MSRIICLCLLGLAAASKQAQQHTALSQHTAAKQTDDPSDDTSDADTGGGGDASADTGYEEAPVAYAEAPVAYAEAPQAPSICYTGQCSKHIPCYNFATGTCSAKTGCKRYFHHMVYQEGEEDGGYRKLQNYGGEYGGPVDVRCGCPAGTHDTHDWSMHKQTVLWVGFGFLFAPALCFLWMSFQKMVDNANSKPAQKGTKPALNMLWEEATTVRINAGMVNMVASLAYLTMATKHGYVTRCNGRDFYYARYVDWIITTPLMLYDLAVVGGSDTNTKLFLCAIDVFMIVSGLIGSLVEDSGAGFGGTSEKWAFFGFSMLAFIPVIWYLCSMSGDGKVTPFSELCNVGMNICSSTGNNSRQKTYQRAMNLTVLTWICYPIIWICAEGTNTISVEGENIAYTVLDILAKSLFGWVLVFSPWHIITPTGPGQLVVGSSML
jgi:bacteriorhodopsin